MKPHEFWNCTYKEAKTFAEANANAHKEFLKEEITLLEALGNKLIGGMAWSKKAKNKSLIKDVFRDLFKDDLEDNPYQSIEEMVRNLRARK